MASTLPALTALADRWRDADAGERANAQLYLTELCDALGVEKPRPAGTGYEFEYTVRIVHRDGSEAVNRVLEVDAEGITKREVRAKGLNDDLSAFADVPSAAEIALLANAGLSSPGFKLHGSGFVLSEDEGNSLLARHPELSAVVRAYRNGRDLTARSRNVFLIDFGLKTEEEARRFPVAFDIVRDRVKPERDANKRQAYRQYWWRFGEPRREWRDMSHRLVWFIVTPVTSKHRFFQRLDTTIAPDDALIAIASNSYFHLGVLSSTIHTEWAMHAGGRLEDRPRYLKTTCFEPFPFPDAHHTSKIADIAERLDAHRKAAIERDDAVTMTGMYNVVEKLRTGEPLTAKERKVHEVAACGVLRDLHDELDRLVADAYGWPWPIETEEILARLVALHDERVEEERRGVVRWLRPEYQVPLFGDKVEAADAAAAAPDADDTEPDDLPDWPDDAIEQLTALKGALGGQPATVEEAAQRFRGAKRSELEKHLETLEVLGVVSRDEDGRWKVQGRAGTVAAGAVH